MAEEFISSYNKRPSQLELETAKYFKEIAESSTSTETRAVVAQLKILKVREVNVEATGKKALIIVVPHSIFRLHIRPNHQRIITEVEKKTKRHVCFIARRSVMRKNTTRPGLRIRPRSRTLTSVQNAILEDLVGPTEIVGRRIRVKVDGKKVHKVFLDARDRGEDIEEKLPTFSAVYHALTSKDAVFEFPEYTL